MSGSGLREGACLFDEGKWWHAHEAWEKEWLARKGEPEGELFRGLIQLAAALLHARRGNRKGALRLLAASRARLGAFRPAAMGVDVDEVLALEDRLQARLAGGRPVDLRLSEVPRLPLREEST